MSGFHPSQLRLVGDELIFQGIVVAKLVPGLPASLLYDLEEKFGRKDNKRASSRPWPWGEKRKCSAA